MTTNETPRPKPAPPKKSLQDIEATTPLKTVTNEKPKFVRKPHLTEKPFRSHEGLQALKKSMDQAGKKTQKKPVRRNNKEKK